LAIEQQFGSGFEKENKKDSKAKVKEHKPGKSYTLSVCKEVK
jgi:hypothetical protein